MADPAWLNDWMARVRYGDRGRGPVEYDCWGAVRYFYRRALRIRVPSYDEQYASSIDGAAIERVIEREVTAWSPVRSAARFGDLVILKLLGRRMHCGVALDRDRFLHILIGSELCVERMSDAVWRRRVDGIYRHREAI